MDLSNYDDMTNDQIRRRLVDDFQQPCGPIVASTRKLFLKKLARLENETGDFSFNVSIQGVSGSFTNGHNGNNSNPKTNQSLNISSVKRKSTKSTSERASVRKSLPATVAKPSSSPKPDPLPPPPPQLATPLQSKKTPPTPQKSTQSVSPKKKIIEKNLPNKHLNDYRKELSETQITQFPDSDNEQEFCSPLESTAIQESTPPPRFRISETLEKFSPKNVFVSRSNLESKSSYKPLVRPPLQRNSLLSYSDSESETEDIRNSEQMTKILVNHRPVFGQNRFVKPTKTVPKKLLTFFGNFFGGKASENLPKSARIETNERDNFTQSSNNVSRLLLRLVIIFFISIVCLYFGLKFHNQKTSFDSTDYSFIEDKTHLVAPICDGTQLSNCFENTDDRKSALNLIRDIRSQIEDYLFKYFCENSNPFKDQDKIIFSSVDLKQNLWEKLMNTDRYKINGLPTYSRFLSDFDNAYFLIRENPSWNMRIDSVNRDLSVTDTYSPNFNISCQAKLAIIRNQYFVMAIFLTISVILFSTVYCRHSKKRAYEEQSEVERLIDESMELLQSPDEPLSIPVLHIRDTLIPASDRQSSKYRKIWTRVVEHMEKSESRVKVELRKIDGEDFKAWKWIGGGSSGFSSSEESDFDTTNNAEQIGGLRWQGTAFSQNTKKGATTKTTFHESGLKTRFLPAFTRFMKVRNYYDKSRCFATPNYQQLIRNSIIEKVVNAKGSHDIVHIGLDEDEKESLIYIKCRTLDGATGVFNSLHGWWCENRLVSVRYLKEERYYQHFPDAKSAEKLLHVE